MNPDFTSNKPTHYLLDYCDFKYFILLHTFTKIKSLDTAAAAFISLNIKMTSKNYKNKTMQ